MATILPGKQRSICHHFVDFTLHCLEFLGVVDVADDIVNQVNDWLHHVFLQTTCCDSWSTDAET